MMHNNIIDYRSITKVLSDLTLNVFVFSLQHQYRCMGKEYRSHSAIQLARYVWYSCKRHTKQGY